jgi:hypothetical protein
MTVLKVYPLVMFPTCNRCLRLYTERGLKGLLPAQPRPLSPLSRMLWPLEMPLNVLPTEFTLMDNKAQGLSDGSRHN